MGFSPSSKVISLWLCGNRRLQTLFRRGGVISVNLIDLSPLSTSRWPLLLGELRGLEHLQVAHPNSGLAPSPFIWHQLTRLPGLKTIDIDYRHAYALFVDENNRLKPLAKFFPKLETLVVPNLHSVPIVEDTNHYPATLTELSYTFDNARLDSALPVPPNLVNFALCASRLSSLNRLPLTLFESLVRLDIDLTNFTADQPKYLPRNLKELRLTTNEISVRKLIDFPPDLTRLEWGNARSDAFEGLNFQSLASLDILILKSYVATAARNAQCNLSRTFLPPALRTLQIGFGCVGTIRLPPSLTSAIFNCPVHVDWPGRIIQTQYAHGVEDGLPHALKALEFRPAHSRARLTRSSQHISSAFVNALPRDLEHLILHTASFESDDWSHLPPSLKSLSIGGSSTGFGRLVNMPLFSNLIQLSVDIGLFCWRDEYCQHLSRNMTKCHLKVALNSTTPITDACLAHLPTSLTSLKIGGDPIDGPEFTLVGLKSLSQFVSLEKLSLSWRLKRRHIVEESMALLPRSILYLKFLGKTSLSSHCWQYLPRNLKTLHWQAIRYVTASDFALLPRGLRTIYLNSVPSSFHNIPALPTTAHEGWFGELAKAPFDGDRKRFIPILEQYPDPRVHTNSFHSHNNVISRRLPTWMYV